MPRPKAAIAPEAARAVLKELGNKASIPELRRELIRRGTPVSLILLRKWKRNKWRSMPRMIPEPRTKAERAVNDATEVIGRIGLPLDQLLALELTLKGKSSAELVVDVVRELFITSSIVMAQARLASDHLLKTNPNGLATVLVACFRMLEDGQEKMRESLRLQAMSMRDDSDPVDGEVIPPEAAPAAEAAPPRMVPFGNLAHKLKLVASSNAPAPAPEVVAPPKANGSGNGHAH